MRGVRGGGKVGPDRSYAAVVMRNGGLGGGEGVEAGEKKGRRGCGWVEMAGFARNFGEAVECLVSS